jgi:hypothetical protein
MRTVRHKVTKICHLQHGTHMHSVKTCPCVPCHKRRERARKIHALVHSKWAHITVFVLVAVGLGAITEHTLTGLSGGVVATKAVELLGEIVADRMLPDNILRDS